MKYFGYLVLVVGTLSWGINDLANITSSGRWTRQAGECKEEENVEIGTSIMLSSQQKIIIFIGLEIELPLNQW